MERCQFCAARTRCPISSVNAACPEPLAAAIRERSFQKHDILQQQGEVAALLGSVKLGTLQATRRGSDGSERPVALFSQGHLLGTYGLLGQRNPLGVRALSSGRLCEIRVADLYRLGRLDPALLRLVHENMAAAHGHLADWAHVMHSKTVTEQLLLSLQLMALEQGHPMIRLPSQQALAALLGSSRESVSRGLRLLEQQGTLTRADRWHCRLNAPDKKTRPD
ncbi:Crp/Fnr family transcriptional regulator [Hydrogenophaga sp.]|uniref:Crp/Fnr family transcriptional regulator n=1 Tax=Hydrogenophaga sp. TaxID=1904254 RepID=UPI0025BFEE40|nr:Crp/Fnr family transcriptional regulator [Hydrogenophaga sp.]